MDRRTFLIRSAMLAAGGLAVTMLPGVAEAAEKAEALFLFRFENFKLCVCGVYAQHCACFFIRFFCGCTCCDCFFYHGFLLPFFFSILYLYPVSE